MTVGCRRQVRDGGQPKIADDSAWREVKDDADGTLNAGFIDGRGAVCIHVEGDGLYRADRVRQL